MLGCTRALGAFASLPERTRQLAQLRTPLLQQLRGQRERWNVRLGEIAVVGLSCGGDGFERAARGGRRGRPWASASKEPRSVVT